MSKFIKSLLKSSSGQDSLETKTRDDGFLTAKGIDALFTRTTPDIDGEECLHDCESCTIKYPKKFSIDEDDKLYGEVNGWSRHILIATGETDWVKNVTTVKDSVMQAIEQHLESINNGALKISASNMPVPETSSSATGPYGPDRPTTVLLLPSFLYVDNVTPNTVPALISSVINPSPTNTSHLSPSQPPPPPPTSLPSPTNGSVAPSPSFPPNPTSLPAGLSLRRCPHKYLILLCSQATRDARCGQSAPLLRRELERHLQPLGLYRDLHDERPGGVGIYFISHVGGHKYSANVLVYRRAEPRARTVREQISAGVAEMSGGERAGTGMGVGNGDAAAAGPAAEHLEAAQCIWLGRVKPEDCENLVRFTVLQGKVVKPDSQLRGGFDRAKGVVSW